MTTISREDVENALAQVKHPAIDCSLADLGIVKEVKVEDETIFVTMAFPFPNIPIKEYLIKSVKTPLEKLGADVIVEITVMSQKELQEFLALEKENWKGS
jgi:metal-sulfur cluster biosynthetic enzyme